jgi:hypothetical protein
MKRRTHTLARELQEPCEYGIQGFQLLTILTLVLVEVFAFLSETKLSLNNASFINGIIACQNANKISMMGDLVSENYFFIELF